MESRETIEYITPMRLDLALPDFRLPRMEIRLKRKYLYGDLKKRVDMSTASLLVGEYLSTLGNERIVSINCCGGDALNYCVCAEGSAGKTDLESAAGNMLKSALLSGADSIVLVHNHPQGEALPSEEDLRGIRIVSYLIAITDIVIKDMVIVGQNCSLFSCFEHYPECFDVDKSRYDEFFS